MGWLILLTLVAWVLGAMLPGVPFWLVWLGFIWPLPLAVLVTWFGHHAKARRVGLGDAPAEYLRAGTGTVRPPHRPGWSAAGPADQFTRPELVRSAR
ncbi:MAG TPA: hypothetical protein VFW65_28850 [Pseudonocardiaceae bacterium]|nr:hypothetical protein [Pseudonocardiaceae bacterium]